MSKKGFTIVELVVIIIIIGIILIFALPNVTSTLERNKKDVMINDAKDMVEKAKSYLLLNTEQYPTVSGGSKDLILSVIDSREEIIESPYGNSYDRNASYVKVTLNIESNIKSYSYWIYLTDGKYVLKSNLSDLISDKKYEKVIKK